MHFPDSDSTLNQERIRALQSEMRGRIVHPSDLEYDTARKVWNGMIDKYPVLILYCEGVGDVIHAVQFARMHKIKVAVRSGGHGVAGNAVCNDGIVIDLSRMKGILVNPEVRTAQAQAGVTWGELDRATQQYGLVTPGGKVSDTGISGLSLGGGLGWLRRKFGLACDNLLSADIVTMDGQLRRISAEQNADLFWGIRGGGGSLGIVVSFEYRLHPIGPEVMFAQVFYSATTIKTALRFFRDYSADAPDEISMFAVLGTFAHDSHFPSSLWGQTYVMLSACYAGLSEEGQRWLAPLRQIDSPILDMSSVRPYTEIQSVFDDDYPRGRLCYYWKSLFLHDLPDDLIDLLIAQAQLSTSPLSTIDIWQMGGAVAQVPADETAFGNRHAPYLLNVEANWDSKLENETNINWTREIIRAAQSFSDGGMYLNFPGLFEDKNVMAQATENYSRLQQLKQQYDPDNLLAATESNRIP